MALHVDSVDEPDFTHWSEATERARGASTSGYLGVQRAVAVRGEPRSLLLYDLESPEPFYAATGFRTDGPATPGLIGWDGLAEHALYEQFFPADGCYEG